MNEPIGLDDLDDVMSLLLGMVEFGRTVTVALEAVADDPQLANNSSVLTLCLLHLEGPQRPGALQARTALTSGGVTKLVERLEGDGLVRRRTGAVREDGRAVVVTITDRGVTQLLQLVRQFSEHVAELATFARDADALAAVLGRLGTTDAS